mmetsp:Transcript_24999/g.30749  ORF Transcript_24999/g.30749 Transcript_24999/m.30749 type:complete len:329 (-) Transcript_24999:185-1171(-)
MCIPSNSHRRSFTEADLLIAFASKPNKDEMSPTTESEEKRVQHNYHDHAFDSEEFYLKIPMVSKGGVTSPFPQKLHDMLDQIERDESEIASIVTWQPHGRCFLVRKPKEFTNDVMQRFFHQKKYASFQRQLNLYGFKRITKGPDRGCYYHELFLRGKKFLCRAMDRVKVKGNGHRVAGNPEQEPNFYLMNPMPSSLYAKDHSDEGCVINAKLKAKEFEPPIAPMMPLITQEDISNSDHHGASKDDREDSFENMPFHSIENSCRRHSLMDDYRRLSLISLSRRRSSIIKFDDENFAKEMEMIEHTFGDDLSDEMMSNIISTFVGNQVNV